MNYNSNAVDNFTNYDWNETSNGPSLHTRIAFASTWIIIAVAGIIGNGLVIFVAIRFQKMNNVTNCFIVNLAITDILFLGFCMPLLVVQYTLEHWSFNQVFCKLLNFTSFVSVLVTVLTLVAMTIDRYIYVVRPFQNLKWRKPSTVLLLSIMIWLISCVFASPFYYHYGVTDIDDYHRECVLLSNEKFQKYFCIYTITLYYFIPLIIILISYAKLLYYVYARENKLHYKSKSSIVKRSKKRRAVTRMVAIVTLAFSLCWLPITLYLMSGYIFPKKTVFLYYFKMIANSLAYLNSAINPILYAFLNRSFRNNCGSLFFEPSCSLFFRDDPHHKRTASQQQVRKNPVSTQVDRFSYQSTNNRSTSSARARRQQKALKENENKQVAVCVQSNPESSDAELEISDVECTHEIPIGKGLLNHHLLTGRDGRISKDESNGLKTLTTAL